MIRTTSRPADRARRVAVLTMAVFLLTLVTYAVSPVRTTFDSRWSIHTAMSFARGHGGDLSAYRPVLEQTANYAIEERGGGPRTVYPIGVSLLVLPAVVVAAWVDPAFERRLRDKIPDRFEQFLASIIAAAAAALFFRLLLDQFGPGATALVGTLAFALGTPMWSTASRALWQHGPLVLFLLLAMLILLRARTRPGLAEFAGLPLAAAFLMRPTAALPILVLSGYVLLRHRAAFLRYLGWAALIGLPWLAFNLAIYGSILPYYYLVASGEHSVTGTIDGLNGVLFSPGRGLFVYSPLVLLSIWGFALALQEPPDRTLHLAFGLVVLLILGLVAQWPIWWGGHSFGPRLLADIIPFLLFHAAFALDRVHRSGGLFRAVAVPACAGLILLSVAMNAAGALDFRGYLWNVRPSNIDLDTARLWDWRDPPFLRPWRAPR